MRRFFSWLRHELRDLFPVWLFFFGAFSLLRLTRSVLLAEHGIQAAQVTSVLVGSLIVAKVFAIADHLRAIERYSERPLVYSVIWKTGIYFVGCLAFQYLDGMIRFLRAGEPLGIAASRSLHEMATPRFWLIQLWLIILLVVYASAREVTRALGRERVMELFFGHSKKKKGDTSFRRSA